jgi:hypothetical protein
VPPGTGLKVRSNVSGTTAASFPFTMIGVQSKK